MNYHVVSLDSKFVTVGQSQSIALHLGSLPIIDYNEHLFASITSALLEWVYNSFITG